MNAHAYKRLAVPMLEHRSARHNNEVCVKSAMEVSRIAEVASHHFCFLHYECMTDRGGCVLYFFGVRGGSMGRMDGREDMVK